MTGSISRNPGVAPPRLDLWDHGETDPVIKILDGWVREPHEGENREEVRKVIISFLKGEHLSMDFSLMGLASLPPVFHLLEGKPLYFVDLTGNPSLTTLPVSFITFLHNSFLITDRLKLDYKDQGMTFSGKEVFLLRSYCAYFLQGDTLPIDCIPAILEGYGAVPQLADFIPVQGPHSLSGATWEVVGVLNPADPVKTCVLVRIRREYREKSEFEQKIRDIFPAIELHPSDFFNYVEHSPFRILFYAVGIRYNSVDGLLMLPGIECLQAGWEKLRGDVKNVTLPELSFVSSDGIASHEAFIKAFLADHILISNKSEFLHDMMVHVFFTLTGIFFSADGNRADYLNKRKLVQEVVMDVYNLIQRATENPRLIPDASPNSCLAEIKSEESLRILPRYLLVLLSARVDGWTATPDYAEGMSFFDPIQGFDIRKNLQWQAYFKKAFKEEFGQEWDEEVFRAVFEAFRKVALYPKNFKTWDLGHVKAPASGFILGT